MPKDFKIGMTLGMVLVIISTLWLAARPKDAYLRTIAAIPQSAENDQLSIINNRSKQQDLTIYQQAQKIKTQRFHIVDKGETLSSISAKYYGSASKWQKILDANRSGVKNANRLAPGTKLIIPD